MKIFSLLFLIFFFSSCDYFNDENQVEKNSLKKNQNKPRIRKKLIRNKRWCSTKTKRTPIKAIQVSSSSLTDEVTAVGSLIADESVVIRPEIDGRITKFIFKRDKI